MADEEGELLMVMGHKSRPRVAAAMGLRAVGDVQDFSLKPEAVGELGSDSDVSDPAAGPALSAT